MIAHKHKKSTGVTMKNVFPIAGYVTEYAVSKDGIKIAYITEGEGNTAIVFVHAWCCNKSFWNSQISHFSKRYKVVAIDMAGHGGSELGRTDYTMDAFAEDVKAVIEKLDLKNVVLVGNSMGGAIILQTAAIIPERIKLLIGADTCRNLEEEGNEQKAEEFLEPLKADFKNRTIEIAKNLLPASTNRKTIEFVAKTMSGANAEMGISVMQNVFRFNGKSLNEKVTCPLKTINSDLWPTEVEINKKYFPSFETKLVKGYGHFIQMENPKLFNTLLEEYLTEAQIN
jgi:pimeloyl-ACP methyl ester carboxylesterase